MAMSTAKKEGITQAETERVYEEITSPSKFSGVKGNRRE